MIDVKKPGQLDRPISIAVVAMGGQGGGVLCDWIVATAEAQGWLAQSTSIAGVAQRTGTTVYYIEMLPPQGGRVPVLSLMPTPGDVDVVIAAELMEAGRSMLRGFVTPDRTTLIASTYRSLTIGEREHPGSGIADPAAVLEAAGVAAKRAIMFDMQEIATRNETVISAALLGALAAADVLPFGRDAFEATVSASGKGVKSSLKAFSDAFEYSIRPAKSPVPETHAGETRELPVRAGHPELDLILRRIHDEFPSMTRTMVFAGVARLVDFQDVRYAHEYLDRIATVRLLDDHLDGTRHRYGLTTAAAKYVAVAMAYDDVIRVADLKTRSSRFSRVDSEVGKQPDQILYTTEFMHPRLDELVGMLPPRAGKWLERRPGLFEKLDKVVNRGRRVRTRTIGWFIVLFLIGSLKGVRRRLLRHEREMNRIEQWFALALDTAKKDYELAVEVLKTQQLIKGYSDTHSRGYNKFNRVIECVPDLIGKPDSAAWLRRLRTAALADEEGSMLAGAVATVQIAFASERPMTATSPSTI